MPQAFNCTMCSAPLDLSKSDGVSVRCRYCGNSSILPEDLRDPLRGRPRPSPGGTLLSIIDRGLKMAEVAQLLHGGNKIAAIRLYRQSFGGSLEEAKTAVEQIERGQQQYTGGQDGAQVSVGAPQQFQAGNFNQSPPVRVSGKKVGLWFTIFVLAIIIPIIVGVYVAIKAITSSIPSVHVPSGGAGGEEKPEPPRFAKAAMEFGSEGIGAGQFKDARAVAVDGEGRIYVAEWSGGRVQVFDPQGKFVTQWMLDPKSATYDIEADRRGVVYVVQPRATYRYDARTGELLGELAKPPNSYDTYYDVEVALDGSVYAISGHYNVVRIGADNTFKGLMNLKEKAGEDFSLDKLAVDGTGNVYALSRGEQTIFKFGPDGRFINRFGGRGDGPGQFRSANGIAVDGQGRVYVSDSGYPIHVFDGSGRYLDSFGGEHPVIYGLAVNDQNEIFAADRNRYKIVKYVLTK